MRNRFLSALSEQIDSQSLFHPNDRWLLAVSGGPDSMALLHGLLELQRDTEWPGPQYLHIAHLNHQLRGAESDTDAEFIREEAKKLGLDCTIGSVDITKAAKAAGESLETTARTERYQFLAQTALQNQCNKIALAHNADDQAETILHRILRGTGIRGLTGIPAYRPLDEFGSSDSPLFVIRPLLTVRRQEIEEFLQTENIAYRIDQSNVSLDHTRNRLRNELLPLLREQYNPQVNQALSRLGQTAEWMTELLNEDAQAELSELTLSRTEHTLCLDLPGLQSKSTMQQTELIHLAMQELSIGLRPIRFQHIHSILQLIAANDSPSQTIHLPNQFVAIRKPAQLILTIQNPENSNPRKSPPAKITLPINQELVLDQPFLGFSENRVFEIHRIRTQQIPGGLENLNTFLQQKTAQEEMLDFDKLHLPLILRTWRQGDRFCPLGADGEKTLGDFFTDHKIPRHDRNHLGLLCDADGICWIPAHRIADRAKITPKTTQILKVTIL